MALAQTSGGEHPPPPAGMITILEGSTFCVCDDRGDVGGRRRPLRRRHAPPVALRADGQRPPPAPAVVREGRVLLGGVLSPQPARRRPGAGRAHDRAVTVRRRGDAGPDHDCNESMDSLRFSVEIDVATDFADIFDGQGATTSRSEIRSTRRRCRRRRPPSGRRRRTRLSFGTATTARGALLASRRPARPSGGRARRRGSAGSSWWTCFPHGDSLPHDSRRRASARSSTHVRDSLAAWQLRVPQISATLGQARPRVRAVGLRPRVAAHARAGRPREAARGGDAVVHDGVRARHDHHVPPDAPLRPRAGAHGAPRARRPAGARGRPVARRGARQDRPRGPHGQGGRQLVRPLLRHR